MKLVMNLSHDGHEVTRVIDVNLEKEYFTELNDIGDDMYDSLMEIEEPL